ncbi:D-amino acid dehydrogenase [Salmonella enterica subsp. enterica]|uniref:D-amino acid dehydrogenase n=1 Tax=Salmonella enterica I TaxID=59201 RepID=A0A379W8G1_SALET|nr:D-amino acid dehydrogenase [Salmonella enterica subsp. enterica]
MRVVILGSGVVGVTSAWYLSQAGMMSPSSIANPAGARNQRGECRTNFTGYAAPWRPLAYR